MNKIEQKEQKEQKFSSPMSIAELNRRINRSENDFKNNKYKTSSELIVKYK